MPIYEFVCRSCGDEFEKIVSFSASSVPACPVCSSDQVERKLGRPAIHFKGSGWYITDSKKSSSTGKNGDNGRSEDKESASEGVTAKEGKEASDTSETPEKTKTSDKSSTKADDVSP